MIAARPDLPARIARWVGLALYLLAGALYLASGLVAPWWAVGVLWGIWIALLVATLRVWKQRPWWVLAAPVFAYLIWVAVVLGGDVFLGWTA